MDDFNNATLSLNLDYDEGKKLQQSLFYDKENNVFNTVYFNIENATRLDVDNSDEFASFVPLWAGINIGEENAKNMVEKIVIPCETVKPEQTAIKLEILRKYGFSEEYDRVKGDFLNSCAAPGTFDNSLACASIITYDNGKYHIRMDKEHYYEN